MRQNHLDVLLSSAIDNSLALCWQLEYLPPNTSKYTLSWHLPYNAQWMGLTIKFWIWLQANAIWGTYYVCGVGAWLGIAAFELLPTRTRILVTTPRHAIFPSWWFPASNTHDLHIICAHQRPTHCLHYFATNMKHTHHPHMANTFLVWNVRSHFCCTVVLQVASEFVNKTPVGFFCCYLGDICFVVHMHAQCHSIMHLWMDATHIFLFLCACHVLACIPPEEVSEVLHLIHYSLCLGHEAQ